MDQGRDHEAVRHPSPPISTHARPIEDLTEVAWESRKSTIYHYYMVEDKGLQVLMDTMGKSHNFHAR